MRETVPVSVESADDEFVFYHQWSLDSRKDSMRVMSDALRHLTTLAAAMLSGSLTILTGYVSPRLQQATAGLFLLALGFGLWGCVPFRADSPANMPMEFRKVQEEAARHKNCLLRMASRLIVAAFVLALIGVIFH